MKSILYLNNKYCTSVNDITNVLLRIDNLESPLFHELRRAFQDGTLSAWLSEGSDYEKELAVKLDQMPPSVTNEVMLRQFNILFADKDVDIQKPSYTEYFRLKTSRCKFGDNIDGEYKNVSSSIYMSRKSGNILLELTFEVLKTANLGYTICVALQNDQKEVLHTATEEVSLKSIGKSFTCRSSFDVSTILNTGAIVVSVDNQQIQTFNLLNRPVPKFSKDCSEQQKEVILNLIKRMKYCDDTTGTFEIFDGKEHEVTLTGYYISPLISGRDYAMIRFNYFNDDLEGVSYYMGDVRAFIVYLNRLSSLNFSLPSEAQWLNAAKRNIIRSRDYEFMQDKWAPSVTMESNINPVCIHKHASYNVLRRNVEERDWGGTYCNFRLVLMP